MRNRPRRIYGMPGVGSAAGGAIGGAVGAAFGISQLAGGPSGLEGALVATAPGLTGGFVGGAIGAWLGGYFATAGHPALAIFGLVVGGLSGALFAYLVTYLFLPDMPQLTATLLGVVAGGLGSLVGLLARTPSSVTPAG